SVQALGLRDLGPVLAGDKQLYEVRGREIARGAAAFRYDRHVGRTAGPALARPMLDVDGRRDRGAAPARRNIGGHGPGPSAAGGFRHAFLARPRARAPSGLAFEQRIETALDALAEHLAAHADLDGLLALARSKGS